MLGYTIICNAYYILHIAIMRRDSSRMKRFLIHLESKIVSIFI